MDTKKILMAVAVVAVIGGGSFYSGMKYADGKNVQARTARLQTAGGGFAGRGGMAGGAGGFVRGEVIAKDAGTLTVKLRDGGSKILLVSDSAEVSKLVKGSLSDVGVGATISANGKANTDGSITVEALQVLPAMK